MAWELVPFVNQCIVFTFFGTLAEWFRYLVLVDKTSCGRYNHAPSCAPRVFQSPSGSNKVDYDRMAVEVLLHCASNPGPL
ncbi:hypothetical protein EDB92DRAFT_1620186 [Lactarius akahatsu]|uniref:Uncharacterized protein n=1 Tax=Lactarius akahatsu TaxID=416441 RepID=A0AAD4L728_9AGAM|nr:hypothetical protein EDB92DRAFT_1620186 [Lactarius akahatsu]